MPRATSKVNFNTMRSAFFFGLIVILGIGMLYLITPFLYPIFWAAVIAVMFYPIYTWLRTHSRMPKVSSLITILIVTAVLFLPLTFVVLMLVSESIDLYQHASQGNFFETLNSTKNYLEQTPLAPLVDQIQSQWTVYASNAGQYVGKFLFDNVSNLTQNSLRFVFMFFIMLYSLYYFFTDGPRMLKRLMHLSPLGDKYEELLYERFTSTTRATLKSTLIIGGIQGLIGGLLFWITGIPSAFVWGVMMVVVAVIPAIGPAIILLPAGIIVLALGQFWPAIVLLVGSVVISAIDNLLRPPLVGKDTQMHPLVVLFSTLGGIILFGVSGFVIGPIIAALFLSIISIYDYYYKKELANN